MILNFVGVKCTNFTRLLHELHKLQVNARGTHSSNSQSAGWNSRANYLSSRFQYPISEGLYINCNWKWRSPPVVLVTGWRKNLGLGTIFSRKQVLKCQSLILIIGFSTTWFPETVKILITIPPGFYDYVYQHCVQDFYR